MIGTLSKYETGEFSPEDLDESGAEEKKYMYAALQRLQTMASFFRGFNAKETKLLAAHFRFRTFKPHEVVFQQGEVLKWFGLVSKGELQILINNEPGASGKIEPVSTIASLRSQQVPVCWSRGLSVRK